MTIARKDELARFESVKDSGEADFVAVYGRRRIGKTFLFRQIFSYFTLPVSLVSMCALAALANYAKADIVSAQEHFDEERNMKSIVVNNPTASIGSVKTPWMFVKPDGNSGFANDFTTNAISVVSEDGINYYAHVDNNGDRTKVIHFTLDKNGIPSKHGDIIDTANSGEENNVEAMKNRKLVGVTLGCLCFYPTEDYGTSLIYNPKTYEVFSDVVEGTTQKCLASCQDEFGVHVLCNLEIPYGKVTRIKKIGTGGEQIDNISFYPDPPFSDERRVMAVTRQGKYYIGDSEGNVISSTGGTFNGIMPGPVSGITV